MALKIEQAPNDKITYNFSPTNLAGVTLSEVLVTSNKLTITNVSNDTTSFQFTVTSGDKTTGAIVKLKITLSNGDIENKKISFSIVPKFVD